jgi:hypothetical protein
MRKILWIAAAVVVFAGAFFGTLMLIDKFFPELGYNVADFPRASKGQTLVFKDGENRGALISGWSNPEPWGVWSGGYEAQLGFVVLGISGQDAKIFIECIAFVMPPKLPEQKLELWSRNIKLGEVTLTKSPNSFSFPLHGLVLGDGHPIILRLKMPFAISPKELQIGNDDVRKLAVGLLSIRFDN